MTVCRVCSHEPCFVHCVYCDVDVNVSEHAAECPSMTGLFPVRERDVMCHGGCGCRTGMRCTECDVEFDVGDLYALIDAGYVGSLGGASEVPVKHVACLGCAALGVVT